jgi:hypothetical protein
MYLKPGSLVTLRKFNLSTKKPITSACVYTSPVEDDFWPWLQGEVGVFLGVEDPIVCCSHVEMARVFHNGRVGWIYEEWLKPLVDDTSFTQV